MMTLVATTVLSARAVAHPWDLARRPMQRLAGQVVVDLSLVGGFQPSAVKRGTVTQRQLFEKSPCAGKRLGGTWIAPFVGEDEK